MKTMLQRFARWLMKKTAVAGLPSIGPSTIDAYRRHRSPTANELLAELKNTAWACANINAAVTASFPPRLYVANDSSTSRPRCLTRSVDAGTLHRLHQTPYLRSFTRKAESIEEVVDHPILELFRQVNPIHNGFDLWELTELYLETHGSAYWLLDYHPALSIPEQIWILPAHLVTPRQHSNSSNIVDYYEFRGRQLERFSPERVIHFRFPDPRDPYCSGMSPLRACFEQVALVSEYAAMRRSVYDNTGLPSVVLTPDEVIGEDERERLEQQWHQKFRQGGQGRALVAESSLKVNLLSHSMGDLAALADIKATKEDIANAFQVPLPFLSSETNLANMEAADHMHKTLAILPRLRRRDEKLNERLAPLYDPTGRLFLASDDPTPANQAHLLQKEKLDLSMGVRTINEIRSARGLAPVPWGDQPWLPSSLRPADGRTSKSVRRSRRT